MTSCKHFLLFLCVLALVSLTYFFRPTKTPENAMASITPATLVSTDDCQNTISLWLDGKKQFRAKIVSDILIYQDIEFAGYYQDEESFILLADIFGNELILEKKSDVYLQKDVPEEEAKGMGWKLKRLSNSQ